MTTPQFQMMALSEGRVTLAHEADDVRGLVVLDGSSHRLGEVDDLVVDDEQRRARLLVVASGGVLGLGAHRHLVPVEAVARVAADHVRLNRSDIDVLAGAEHEASRVDPGDYVPAYEHYGCTPFWEQARPASYLAESRA